MSPPEDETPARPNKFLVATLVIVILFGAGWLATAEPSDEESPRANESVEDTDTPMKAGPLPEVEGSFEAAPEGPVAELGATELADGVSLRGALLHFLTERAADGDGIVVGDWETREKEQKEEKAEKEEESSSKHQVFTLKWASGESLEEEARVVRFVRQADGEVKAEREAAETIVAHAESLEKTTKAANVYPKSFRPDAKDGEIPWSGKAERICQMDVYKTNCRTMERTFSRTDIRVGVGWMIAALAGDAELFSTLRQRGDCKWKVGKNVPSMRDIEWATHMVQYRCPSVRAKWHYSAESHRYVPVNTAATLLAVVDGAQLKEGATLRLKWKAAKEGMRGAAE